MSVSLTGNFSHESCMFMARTKYLEFRSLHIFLCQIFTIGVVGETSIEVEMRNILSQILSATRISANKMSILFLIALTPLIEEWEINLLSSHVHFTHITQHKHNLHKSKTTSAK